MIKCRWFPAVNSMTGGASMIEVAGNVVWIVDLFKVGLVAAVAFGGSAGEMIVNMALGAIDSPVRAGKLKAGEAVVK